MPSGICAIGVYIIGSGAIQRRVTRIAHDPDNLPRRLGKGSRTGRNLKRSFSGSPFGQYCFAIASLMITTPGAAPLSCFREHAAAQQRNLEGVEVIP